MEIIQSSIKCQICHKVFESPVMLPCGESICLKHVQDQEDRVFCINCSSLHEKPANGFIKNKPLEKLIAFQIEKLNFGESYTNAVKSCQVFKKTIESFRTELNDPSAYINKFVSDLKNRVDLKRDEMKLKIDNESQMLIEDLDLFEKACIQDLPKKDNLVVKSREKNDINSKLVDYWLDSLTRIEINEKEWNTINEVSYSDNNLARNEIYDFNAKLLLGNKIKYEIMVKNFCQKNII